MGKVATAQPPGSHLESPKSNNEIKAVSTVSTSLVSSALGSEKSGGNGPGRHIGREVATVDTQTNVTQLWDGRGLVQVGHPARRFVALKKSGTQRIGQDHVVPRTQPACACLHVRAREPGRGERRAHFRNPDPRVFAHGFVRPREDEADFQDNYTQARAADTFRKCAVNSAFAAWLGFVQPSTAFSDITRARDTHHGFQLECPRPP